MTNLKITATSVEEFKEIEAILETLPEKVISQISNVRSGLIPNCPVECEFKNQFSKDAIYFLPKETTEIKNFGDHIGIYAKPFYFRIPGEYNQQGIQYIILK
jgi:hypothetical protein